MNNSIKLITVCLSVFLIVALFVAMICSYFLPFGEEKVFAEVDSISTNYTYSIELVDIGTYNYTNQYGENRFSSAGVFYVDNVTFSFSYVGEMYHYSGWGTSSSSYFTLYSNSSYSTCSAYRFYYSYYGVFQSLQYRPQNGSFSTVSFNSLAINFSTFSVNSVTNYFFTKVCVDPNIIHSPDIHLFTNAINNVLYNAYDFVNDDYYYDLTSLDNFIFYDSSDFVDTSSSFTSINFRCFSSDNQNVYSDSITCTIYNGLAWFSLSLPDTHISRIFFYYEDYESDGVMFTVEDLNEYVLLWRDNYTAIADSYTDIEAKSIRDNYLSGYNTGINTDKTLLSVMWQTFNLPFRLLFGTYDDNPQSVSYQSYVGGLFNFTLLGVDLRGFCIGIMSFAIILAIVRLILGMRGN